MSSYSSDSKFGPPSQKVNIKAFLEECSLYQRECDEWVDWNDIVGLSLEQKTLVEEQCSMNDLNNLWKTPLQKPPIYAHILKTHDDTLQASVDPKSIYKGKKRKRSIQRPLGCQDEAEANVFKEIYDKIPLQSWGYPAEGSLFIRGSKNSDFNTLEEIRSSKTPESGTPGTTPNALITISVYNRLSWGNTLSRTSQHAVLASQTLSDLYNVIPCSSKRIPTKPVEQRPANVDGVRWSQSGAVMCIEGVAYGEGEGGTDYAGKLIELMGALPLGTRGLSRGPSMNQQRFMDVQFRIQEPYWLLHHGNCEHFLVVDQIRMLDRSDPQRGYPITLHNAPEILDLCQACKKVPAMWSISGDTRLGQSPCALCSPCRRAMGETNESGVVVAIVS